jgi:Molecular chaperone, HSP90 family
VTETETLNSMIPLWKKRKTDITEDEYNNYYKETFFDYENPLKVIHVSAEGAVSYNAVLYIPSRAPYNYYSKTYEKGLKLYNDGVMITERSPELLPDYFSFVKGVVDSDLTLNISRETVQHDRQLKKIAQSLEKKIKAELENMLSSEREKYEKFFQEFGLQLKYGVYEGFGMNKDALQDLLLYRSVNKDKMITLKEYSAEIKEGQKFIFYAPGKSAESVKALPQAEKVLDGGFDILVFSDDIDEFAVKFLGEYDKREFRSISAGDSGLEERAKTEEGETDKEILNFIKDSLGKSVASVRFSDRLKTHPVCLTSEGELSIEMEKVFGHIPNSKNLTAEKILEINRGHAVYDKLADLFSTDKEKLKKYATVLLNQARLIEGLNVENPSEYADLVIGLLS